MSYDRRPSTRYAFGNVDFGGSNATYYILGPKGKDGQLYDYGVFGLTEAFAGTTTTPVVAVGIEGNPDAYGEEFDLGAMAVTVGGKSLRTTYHMHETGYKSTYLVDKSVDMDVAVLVSITASTGSATGQGVLFCDIIWDL